MPGREEEKHEVWPVIFEKEIVLTIINRKKEAPGEDGLMAELLARVQKDGLTSLLKCSNYMRTQCIFPDG